MNAPQRALLLVPLLLLGCPADHPGNPKTDPKTDQTESSTPVKSSSPRRRLTILATGDVGSDTDVCGCKAHPLGGIGRRAKVVKERSEDRAIVLDAGDLFFRTWSISPRYHAQSKATAEFMADASKMMGTAAIAVGERDLALGLAELKRLGERSGAKLLSANLVFASSSSAAFDAFTVIEKDGMKIGLVGASPELSPNVQAQLVYQQNHLKTKPLLESIEAAARAARAGGAEVVIALLHVGQQRALETLGKLPAGAVDVALVAHDRLSGNIALLPGGRSAWTHTGSRGKWLVAVELDVVEGATGLMDVGALDAQKKAIAAIDDRIAAYAKESASAAATDPAVAEKIAAERAATVQRLSNRKKQLQAELDGLTLTGKHSISGEMIPLETSLADDPDLLARYREFQDHLIEVNSGAPPPDRAELEYTGSKACKSCHEPMYAQWEKTKHSKAAWETMIRTRQTGNLDCIQCHVTGFDRRGGPASLLGLEKFVNVGCESCHGPGSAHVKNPKVQLDYGKVVPEKVCAECHRAQEDQKPFDYEERLPKVTHGPRLGR